MSKGVLADLVPADIGLGQVFPSFRPIQLEAMEFSIYSEERVVGLGLPTGSGKTGVALGIQALTGWRTIATTATKGLMQQYVEETRGKYPLVDLKGKANYSCTGSCGADNCEEGLREGCNLRMPSKAFNMLYQRNRDLLLLSDGLKQLPSCAYDCRRMEALLSPLVVTNYALWLYSRQGWGPVDLLILDEAHDSMSQLSQLMSTKLYQKELLDYLHLRPADMPTTDKVQDWTLWAVDAQRGLKADLAIQRLSSHKEKERLKLQHMEKLDEKLDTLTSMDEDWIVESRTGRYGRTWEFDAVWPGRYAESRLFKGIAKVVLMSATLKPKAITDLGVKRGEFAFKEWRRVFQRSRCPIYFMPPIVKGHDGQDRQVRVTRKTSEGDLLAWVKHMDRLIEQRLDVRVVLITTSYRYQEFIMEHSRHASYMIGNTQDPDSDTATEVFEKFIHTSPPVILCSPSFGTGWNFSDGRCRFLVISKVPLKVPGSADKLMAARLKRDKEYGDNLTMQEVSQAVGRPQRSDEDWAEVVLTDGSWGWFGPRNAHLAPLALVKDVRRVEGGKLPAPPRG